jgi:hypothetical protein
VRDSDPEIPAPALIARSDRRWIGAGTVGDQLWAVGFVVAFHAHNNYRKRVPPHAGLGYNDAAAVPAETKSAACGPVRSEGQREVLTVASVRQ